MKNEGIYVIGFILLAIWAALLWDSFPEVVDLLMMVHEGLGIDIQEGADYT